MTFEARDNAAKVVPATSGNNNEDERKASLKVTIFTVILSRAGGKCENLGGGGTNNRKVDNLKK